MNVSIRSPNNIFIRWIFVFGIVFSGFFVNSFNVFANESESLVVGPHNAESINSFLKTVDKTKTNYIVKRYLYYDDGNLVNDTLRLAYTNDPVFLDNNKLCTTRLTVNDNYYWYTASTKYNEWLGSNTSGLEDVKFLAVAESNSPTYGNKVVVSIVDYNIISYAENSNKFEPPTELNKDDVNTYPVGHLEIINPSGALSINYSDKYNAYPVDVKIRGKIPFQIKFGQESEISADKVKSILQKEIYNTMDFTMIGSNNTYTRSDKTFLNDNDPKLVIFGTKSDWIDNEYLTFEYTFKLYLKDKGDYNFNSFIINVPTWWEHTFFGIGIDKFKDFKADDVKFSINAYKDLNGDGVDDETGEVIPPQTDLDVDDDDWDHMTFLEKAEYLITSIPSFLGNIFDSLINTIANTVQLVNSVVAQGGTIAGLVTNLFDFFPAPIPQMITVTIGVMIFITFLSWVKK